LLPISAMTPAALDEMHEALTNYVQASPTEALASIAHTLQTGRREFAYSRTLVVASDGNRLVELDRRRNSEPVRRAEPQLAFVFPGVGGQYVDMAAGLYASAPRFRATVDHCAEVLRDTLGSDIRSHLFPCPLSVRFESGSKAKVSLRRMLRGECDEETAEWSTSVTHCALFAIEVALADLLLDYGIRPSALVGHSLGEYAAAYVAGVMSLDDALYIIVRRARLIETTPPGRMLAVAASEAAVYPLLSAGVALAAVNSPRMCTLSGQVEVLERAAVALADRGVETAWINSAHALHSPVLSQARAELADILAGVKLSVPTLPVASAVTGRWLSEEEATSPDYWARQLVSTVQFDAAVKTLRAREVDALIEIGPSMDVIATDAAAPSGKGTPGEHVRCLRHRYEQMEDLSVLLGALGRLWELGESPNWSALRPGETPWRVLVPTYPFQRQRCWIDPPDVAPIDPPPAASHPRSGSGRSFTSTWMHSTLPSNSATIGICAASRSPSAAPANVVSWRRRAMKRGSSVSAPRCRRFLRVASAPT
jgi:acyl transferase domain-containing protein